MKALKIFFLALLMSSVLVGNVYAEINWSVWLWQPDGSYWRTGVDENGVQHCQTKPSENGDVKDVSCSK